MNRPFCLLPCWFNLFLPGAKATRYGIYFIAFLFCATPLFTLAQYSPNKQINHVSSKLSSEKVRSVIQDQKGFLWAATEDGLNKYDGYTFEVFKNIPGDSTSIPDNDVYTLATGPDGKIWAGYSNGWLTCYDHLTHHFSTLQAAATGLPEDLITRLFFDKRGRMWVAVKRHGLFYYNKINHRFIKAGDLPDIHPGYQINPTYYNNYNTIYDIHEDAQGSFWLATHDGLYQYNPVTNLFKSIRQKQIVPFEDRYDLFQKILISQEGFWLSSWGGGLTFYNIKTHEWKNYKMTTGSPGTHNIIESIEWKQDDQLWIASRDAGFGYFDITKGKFTFLYDSPCTKILKDRGEMIWVASDDEGLMQFDPTTLFSSQHVNVTRSDNGRHYFVNGIYHNLTTHQLFYGVAYGDGLHVYDELTQKETVHPFDVLPNSEQMLSVSSIYPDNRDSLWVLTTDYIYLFDRQHHSLKKFQQPFDHAPDRKKVITPDYYDMLRASGGDLWITSLNQGVLRYRFDEKGFTSYTKQGPYGLLSNSTKAIEEDGYQRIWMIAGNEISLFSYTDNRFHGIESFTSSATDLSKVKFSDLAKSPDGDIWISSDNGIYQYRHQSDSLQLIHWPPGKDIPSGKIKYIKSDQNGNIWFLTPSTLWCLQPKDKKITYSIATKIIESPSSFYIDQHNDIFLATYGGYSTFSPKKQSAQRNKPPLVITSFAVNNKVISLDSLKGKEVRLSHDQNSLTIEFSVLDFRNPSKNNYSFWMEGIDSDWRLSTDRHLADYGHLAPGHYTFKVKGIAEDGVWSDPVEIKIFIAPPLWATWYFVAAILLIICYFIYLLSRWRASVIRKEEVLKSAFEKKILETEMSTLRAQMNPHFIFNSLNSINRYILMADRDTASFYLTKFSKLIRLILENSNKTRISLDQELTALKHYIDMELLRFDHGFSYHIHIDEDVDPVFIQFPPLIIQPYVENSIWHGFIRRGTYGVLTITIKKETPEILVITVEDNGVGRNFKKKTLETSSKKSHGLKITEDRLSILSREGYTSSVEIIDLKNAEGEPSGTKVVIRISIIMVTQEKETIAL